MSKRIMAVATALALAASASAIPTRANADDVLQVVPDTIDAASNLVIGTVDAVLYGDRYAYNDAGPRADCYPGRQRGPDGRWHRVRVCPY